MEKLTDKNFCQKLKNIILSVQEISSWKTAYVGEICRPKSSLSSDTEFQGHPVELKQMKPYKVKYSTVIQKAPETTNKTEGRC